MQRLSDNTLRGALLLILGELLLAVMAAMIKHVSAELPSEVIVFFRNLLGLMILMPMLINHGGLRGLHTRRIGIHLFRAATGVGAMFCFFYAIAHIPLAEAVLVKMTAPFFLPLVGWLWLGDRIGTRTFWAIVVGFVGVTIVLRPAGDPNPVLLVALLGALLMSLAKVSIRRMADTEPPRRIIFWFGVFSTLISAVPLAWARPLPSPEHWPWLIGIGLLATVAQLAMTTAYQIATPGRIGVYNYTSVVWAALLGWMFWGELLHWSTAAGMALIVAAGVWNLRKKKV